MQVRERLRATLGESAPIGRHEPQQASVRVELLGLQSEETGRGQVHFAEEWWPLTHRHGDYQLGEALELGTEAAARLLPDSGGGSLRDAAFVDIETTGLSGGTGTLVFLVGVGTFEDRAFVLRQYFLADLATEEAMLARVADVLDGRQTVVSFNGRRFDLPLILTRLTLARTKAPSFREHLDLLYPSQWLYKKRLRSCSLGTLETCVLGLRRDGDVGGSLAPAIYMDYLRTGRAGGLRGVFEHNALDVLSLASLVGHLSKVCEGTDASAEDLLALGHWDEAANRFASAITMFRGALPKARTAQQRSTARRRLGRLYKRLGKLDQAMVVWQEEVDVGSSHGKTGALIELAKVNEHKLKDFGMAETLTRQALNIGGLAGCPAPIPTQPELVRPAMEHRLKRLRRRRSRATSEEPL